MPKDGQKNDDGQRNAQKPKKHAAAEIHGNLLAVTVMNGERVVCRN